MQTIRSMRRVASEYGTAARCLRRNRRTRDRSAYLAGLSFELALKAAFFKSAGFAPSADVEALAKRPDMQRNGRLVLTILEDPQNAGYFLQGFPIQRPLGHNLAFWYQALLVARTTIPSLAISPPLITAVTTVIPLWSAEIRYAESVHEEVLSKLHFALSALTRAGYIL